MIAASGGNDHRCVRACGLHSDSRFYTATVGMHEDSGEQKEDSLSLSLSLFSFTHLAFLSSLYVLVYTHIHTYTPVESVHVYIHAYRRSVVVCCSKREKWFAEGGGMKREGEEGEELKLPGKERNRVGLNLLDCFQLHASSYSLSLFIPFFLYSPSSSLVDTLRPSPLSFPLPSSPSLR